MTSVSLEKTSGAVRPSKLIAEALVWGHDSAKVVERAEAMGLPENLTRAVVSVCCRDRQNSEHQSGFESAD